MTDHSQLSLPLSKDQAHRLVDAVMEEDGLALSATAHEAADGQWVFEALCDREPDLGAFTALAQRILGGVVDFDLERVDMETDWVGQSLAGLKPVHAGGFYIYGSHDKGHVPAGQTGVLIDAAQAFGTGHHATTTGCLVAIDQLVKRGTPMAMLDVGTGTGVLAIALAKHTRRVVMASDIDPISVKTARANARQNGVGGRVMLVTAAGLGHRALRENGPYDLIVANILAGPLRALAKDIGAVARPGATIILSGLLVKQAARVISRYRAHHMVLKKRIVREEWATLVLEKR